MEPVQLVFVLAIARVRRKFHVDDSHLHTVLSSAGGYWAGRRTKNDISYKISHISVFDQAAIKSKKGNLPLSTQ